MHTLPTPPDTTRRPDRAFSTPAVVASCVGFVLIGALQSLYGPALPALRSAYGLSPSGAGLALSAHFGIGAIAGPAARRAGALVIAASVVGGVAAGPALGKTIELFDVRTVPAVLFVLAAACLAATCWLTRATRSPLEPARDPGAPLT
ncbi:hypothetical protein ACFVT9_10650 [Kitasatospora cineracea]|uniref:hypothetical protein n=1 Tax=Kitasatospora cineracea TaxID=88074 RepID=UPI0036DC8C0A